MRLPLIDAVEGNATIPYIFSRETGLTALALVASLFWVAIGKTIDMNGPVSIA
jgi:hypothetical protein